MKVNLMLFFTVLRVLVQLLLIIFLKIIILLKSQVRSKKCFLWLWYTFVENKQTFCLQTSERSLLCSCSLWTWRNFLQFLSCIYVVASPSRSQCMVLSYTLHISDSVEHPTITQFHGNWLVLIFDIWEPLLGTVSDMRYEHCRTRLRCSSSNFLLGVTTICFLFE